MKFEMAQKSNPYYCAVTAYLEHTNGIGQIHNKVLYFRSLSAARTAKVLQLCLPVNNVVMSKGLFESAGQAVIFSKESFRGTLNMESSATEQQSPKARSLPLSSHARRHHVAKQSKNQHRR